MANIIGLKEKQLALKEITRKLKTLVPINEFLSAKNPTGVYTISFGEFQSKLLCEDAETIRSCVFAYKKKVVDEIREQATKFSIEFDEEEEKLLG